MLLLLLPTDGAVGAEGVGIVDAGSVVLVVVVTAPLHVVEFILEPAGCDWKECPLKDSF